MEDRTRDAIDEILDDAPLTHRNVRAMIALAIEAHFQRRSERVWLWIQRLGWIVAIVVGLSALLQN